MNTTTIRGIKIPTALLLERAYKSDHSWLTLILEGMDADLVREAQVAEMGYHEVDGDSFWSVIWEMRQIHEHTCAQFEEEDNSLPF